MHAEGGAEHERGERSMMDDTTEGGDEPASQLPPPSSANWADTLELGRDMVEVIKEGAEEDVALVYEALDLTFKWKERCRERVENAHNEETRLHRQIEAKKDALEKIKATSTARENQAEIYSVEQSAFEEARKIKEFDASLGSIKARTSKIQTELAELEQSEPTRASDFVIGASVLKTKLYHDLGFMQVRPPLQEATNSDPEKLFIRCDSHCTASRVVRKPKTNRDGFTLSNEIWDAIS
ncbi:hypothetical protein PCANC_14680 [Puccinia coronata f. sp. avenae]|uniref:Kinetochore protein Spc24 n=1 Tax=Puccinia coronata f. sp. avenae TaxID=200324 RepID=A0A2N5UCH2_9BASI|nr:hypothetical protein PCASD_19609 [Puccinia coronata f. sp. avenae]PLW35445.1 hypothetical protein PCANC_14680 [Puccinia coronata f. sp. avenae]PLW40518.1 hypothetical protein PCASD_08859 [Puccinia coronata f. sp. avenae]